MVEINKLSSYTFSKLGQSGAAFGIGLLEANKSIANINGLLELEKFIESSENVKHLLEIEEKKAKQKKKADTAQASAATKK